MIQFVGGAFSSGTSSGSFTTSLTALVSGIDTRARVGDLVVASTAASNNATSGTGVSGVAGVEYSMLFRGYANDNLDAALCVCYKYLTAEDATCLHYSNGLTTRGMVGLVTVWRNVNSTTPITQSGAAASTNTGRPNPPSVTPTIPGSIVLAIGAGTARSGTAFGGHLVPPASYTYGTRARHSGTVVSGGVNGYVCWRTWPGYAAEDPGAFTSGSISSSDSALGISIVLNPEPGKSLMTVAQN